MSAPPTRTKAQSSIATAARRARPVLGGGSNVLISDGGVRGIVVRFHGGEVTRLDDGHDSRRCGRDDQRPRPLDDHRGVAGLEAWAGTPGTVGGAIYGNAHFKGRLISELVTGVTLVIAEWRTVASASAPRWSSATTTAACTTPARSSSSQTSAWRRRPRGAASRRARIARLPQAHAAARISERRLHLPESGPGDG